MPATAAQFASLAQFFGNAATTALVQYVDAEVAPVTASIVLLNQAITALQQQQPPGVPVSVTPPLDLDFQASNPSRGANVSYVFKLVTSLTILGPAASAVVTLTANGAVVGACELTTSGALSFGATTQGSIFGYVPPNATLHLTTTQSGGGTLTAQPGQETPQ